MMQDIEEQDMDVEQSRCSELSPYLQSPLSASLPLIEDRAASGGCRSRQADAGRPQVTP